MYYLAGVGVASLILVFCWLYRFYPKYALYAYLRYRLYSTGLRVKHRHDPAKVCYAERGRPSAGVPSILLIHGFSSAKDAWVGVLQHLPKEHHVITIDLPGHGGSSPPTTESNISLDYHIETLRSFIIQQKLNNVIVVGQSFGGLLAGVLAASHSHLVHGLVLVCPAMMTPTQSDFYTLLRAGECYLIPETQEEVERMFNWGRFQTRTYSHFVKTAVLQLRRPHNAYFRRAFEKLFSEEMSSTLNLVAPDIRCPVAVTWGVGDKIIDSSGAEHLADLLPDVKSVTMIPRCGHSAQIDQPAELAGVISSFLRDHYSNSN